MTVRQPTRTPARATQPEGTASPLVYAIVRNVARLLIPIFARLRTEGLEHIPAQGPVILALNHIAWMDIPLVSLRIPRISHYMAKLELFQVPVLGAILRACGTFSVRRGESDREALRTAARLIAAGELLVIFPEGHRSGNGQLAAGLPGVGMIALRADVPVIPVAIAGSQRVFHSRGFGPFAPQVRVRFGAPLRHPHAGAHYTRADMTDYTEQIMRAIAALLPPENRGVYAEPPHALPAAPGAPDSGGSSAD